MSYWELVLPTYIENWTPKLYNLSIAQIDIPITFDDAKRIVEIIWDNKKHDLSHIAIKLDDAISKMPNGAFVRLGSRSPKDSFIQTLKVTNSKEALSLLIDSERVFDDLCLAINKEYNPHIWVRQWIDIPKWTEFRCFMLNRKLIGISQYYYFDGIFKEILENHNSIKWAIEQFFEGFKSISHLDNVVFDVYLKQRTHGNEVMWEVRLIEINPFFELTDPCLFNWANSNEFNGNFKYITDNSQVPEIKPTLRNMLANLQTDSK